MKFAKPTSKYPKGGYRRQTMNYMESEIGKVGNGLVVLNVFWTKGVNPCNVQGGFPRAPGFLCAFVSWLQRPWEMFEFCIFSPMLDMEDIDVN